MAKKKYTKDSQLPANKNNSPQKTAIDQDRPHTNRQSNGGNGAAVMHRSEYSGPIPPPAMLAQYNELVSDAAERILAMAEENARHGREMEKTLLNEEVAADVRRSKEVKRGQVIGACLAGGCMLLAGYALFLGFEAVAGTICGITMISLTTVFVTGRKVKGQQEPKSEKEKG